MAGSRSSRTARTRSSRPCFPAMHRAHDHDHPDHLVDLPRAVHRRAGPSSRRARSARRDALGDGQAWSSRGPRRRRRRRHPRTRSRPRRGDRRLSGDRQLHSAAALDLRAGRHAREPYRHQYQGAVSNIQVASLIYLALILLVITFITNFAAQRIVKRFALSGRAALMDAPISLRRRAAPGGGSSSTSLAEFARARCRAVGDRGARDPRLVRLSRGRPRAQPGLLHKGPGGVRSDRGGVAPALVGSAVPGRNRDGDRPALRRHDRDLRQRVRAPPESANRFVSGSMS